LGVTWPVAGIVAKRKLLMGTSIQVVRGG
jgi:hypothetical protein